MNVPRFSRNVFLAIVPAALVWLAVLGFYNRFLTIGAENLLHLTEVPNVTKLDPLSRDPHYVTVRRTDFPPAKAQVYSVRVTDVHYHLVLLMALFLATPVPWKERLSNLGWAVMVTIFFDLLLLFFWVKFAYATQLGDWSLANYGAFGRNFFGLGKHLLDLPFKLGLPLALWAAFYYPSLVASTRGGAASPRPG